MAKFILRNIQYSENVALVEMPEELLETVVDSTTMTLRPIKNGAFYTLIPFEENTSHGKLILEKIKKSFENIVNQPSPRFGVYLNRMDELLETLALLFTDVKIHKVDNQDDLDDLINRPEEAKKIIAVNPYQELLK